MGTREPTTVEPTPFPSESPTELPTESPSAVPTYAPTLLPTSPVPTPVQGELPDKETPAPASRPTKTWNSKDWGHPPNNWGGKPHAKPSPKPTHYGWNRPTR